MKLSYKFEVQKYRTIKRKALFSFYYTSNKMIEFSFSPCYYYICSLSKRSLKSTVEMTSTFKSQTDQLKN